jgi:hypothetical protein
MTKQTQPTRVEIYGQEKYDLWLASKPDFSRITYLRVINTPGLTALPDLPAVTYLWVENTPGLTALPDLPAVTYLRVDDHLRKAPKAGA